MPSLTPSRLPARRLLVALLLVIGSMTATLAVSAPAQAATGRYIVLVPGDRGTQVVKLQRYLNAPVTRYFGPRTKARVVTWQRNHGRHATGRVGRYLWNRVVGIAGRTTTPSRSTDRVTALNWGALAQCESGGNPRAVNAAGYYGLYQFSPATWRSVGGSGLPSSASRAEQTLRAQTLFRRSGSSPWPVCGKRLFS